MTTQMDGESGPVLMVRLGRIDLRPRVRVVGDRAGMLFHHLGMDAVVLVERRCGQRWRGGIIARREGAARGVVAVTDEELDAARTVVRVEPLRDPDGMAMVWRALVLRRWPGGRLTQLAGLLVDEVRPRGSLTVDLGPGPGVRVCLALAKQERRVQLTAALRRLVEAGFLTVTGEPWLGSWGVYTLSLPDSATGRRRSVRPTPPALAGSIVDSAGTGAGGPE